MNERQHTLVRVIDKDYQTDNLAFTDRDGTCCIRCEDVKPSY